MVAPHLARLARHSAVYGVGDFVARFLGVLLLPLYTAYLTPADYGQIEILVAGSAVLLVLLRRGVSEGFFRFYFDSTDAARRTTVVRTTFWFTMTTATAVLVLGLIFAEPLARLLQLGSEPDLVRAAVLGLWAQLNYTQLMVVYRAEERAVAFSVATLATVITTIAATVLLVVVLEEGALGALIGTFAGTLLVYCALLFTRRSDLGLEFSRPLLRQMNRFGAPLVPAALGALGDQLRRQMVHRGAPGPGRGRRVLGRSARGLRGLLHPAGIPPSMARARILDHRRHGSPPDIRVRAHVRRLHHLVGGSRPHAARAVDRAPANERRELLPCLGRRGHRLRSAPSATRRSRRCRSAPDAHGGRRATGSSRASLPRSTSASVSCWCRSTGWWVPPSPPSSRMSPLPSACSSTPSTSIPLRTSCDECSPCSPCQAGSRRIGLALDPPLALALALTALFPVLLSRCASTRRVSWRGMRRLVSPQAGRSRSRPREE